MAPLEGFARLPAENNFTLDQAYEWHRIHSSQTPAFVYPDDRQRKYISWKQLGDAIDVGVQYIKRHIPVIENETDSSSEPLIVAILAAADPLTFATFLLASIRLTHMQTARPIIPFVISPRNSPVGVAHLLKLKRVRNICVTHGSMQLLYDDTLKHLEPEEVPSTFTFPRFQDLYYGDSPISQEVNQVLRQVSLDKPAIILHSSGSTSFPKPITITHQMLMEWAIRFSEGNGVDYLQGEILSAQNAPMFHVLGFFMTGWAVYHGFIRSVQNPLINKVPSDPESFLEEMIKSGTTVGYTVPSFLEAWANNPDAIHFLKTLKVIFWAGGPLDTRTAHYLLSGGLNLVMGYGATEVGPIVNFPDKMYAEGFEWFQLSPSADPHLVPYYGEPDTFELVFKATKGHHLGVINTQINGTPAYATSDLVERHPTNPKLLRIKGRVDDQIIHSTGEKTNPVPLERLVAKNPHVKAAVIFGRAKPTTGVIIEPASWDMVERLGLEKFRNLIWPNVEEANELAPENSHIFKEMIMLASPSKPFTYTPKNTVRRAAVIKEYEGEIEALYAVVKNSGQTDIPPPELDERGAWSFKDTHNFIKGVVHSIIKNAPNMKDDDDIFVHGCDSLQATYIRNIILHALQQTASVSGVKDISSNFVYRHPTINALADSVSQITRGEHRTGDADLKAVRQQRLRGFISKYTRDWLQHQPRSVRNPDSEVVLLTGSTGGLGSQVLAVLINTPTVSRIYAFNRPSKVPIRQRHVEAFTKRGNDVSLLDSKKVVFVEGDTSARDLGIDSELFNEIRDSVTSIMHSAWRVDFNISLVSFEPAIRGLRHLIDLALASPHMTPPRLLFSSSIGNVKLWADVPAVPEAPFKDIDLINLTGYNESKWICEQILETASLETSLRPVIVRVGQLSGGINGNWNDREWFPALVKASQVLKAVPETEGLISFVPLHLAAETMVELRNSPCTFANLVHPRPITWRKLIEWVSEKLDVAIIPYSQWLVRLEAAPRTSEALQHNPALLLLDFYRSAVPTGNAKDLQSREAMGVASYETTNTISNAPTLHPDRLPQLTRDDVHAWVHFWKLS